MNHQKNPKPVLALQNSYNNTPPIVISILLFANLGVILHKLTTVVKDVDEVSKKPPL